MTDLRRLTKELQRNLAQVDLLTRPARSSGGFTEFLIVKRDNLKLKMYQETGHNLPHIHIDYGKVAHAASYGVDPPVRIAGKLASKYDRSVLEWLREHKDELMMLWELLQAGDDPSAAVVSLRGDA
jgi:hypothetical protein